MAITVLEKKCISCGACVVLCPVSAITLRNGSAHIDQTRCIQCGTCIYKCYMRAIQRTT